MHDFSCANPDDMKYKVLAERARYLKQDEKGEANMSKLMEELVEELMEDEKIESAEEMLKDGALSVEQISRYLRLPLEKIKELANQLQPQMA